MLKNAGKILWTALLIALVVLATGALRSFMAPNTSDTEIILRFGSLEECIFRPPVNPAESSGNLFGEVIKQIFGEAVDRYDGIEASRPVEVSSTTLSSIWPQEAQETTSSPMCLNLTIFNKHGDPINCRSSMAVDTYRTRQLAGPVPGNPRLAAAYSEAIESVLGGANFSFYGEFLVFSEPGSKSMRLALIEALFDSCGDIFKYADNFALTVSFEFFEEGFEGAENLSIVDFQRVIDELNEGQLEKPIVLPWVAFPDFMPESDSVDRSVNLTAKIYYEPCFTIFQRRFCLP